MSWKSLKRYYVYTYLNESNIPYYVGMGHGNRVISKNHRVPVPEFHTIPIIDDLTQSEAWNLEIELIRKYGREDKGLGTLKNLTDGGPTQKSGWNHSNETKKKISDGNLGKQRSEKQKLNYRKPKSKQHAENIRKANLGRPYDERYVKIALTKSKQRWYNNGEITRMFEPGKEDVGFMPGRKMVK